MPVGDGPKNQLVAGSKAVLPPQRVVPAGPRVCTKFRHAVEPVAAASPSPVSPTAAPGRSRAPTYTTTSFAPTAGSARVAVRPVTGLMNVSTQSLPPPGVL